MKLSSLMPPGRRGMCSSKQGGGQLSMASSIRRFRVSKLIPCLLNIHDLRPLYTAAVFTHRVP